MDMLKRLGFEDGRNKVEDPEEMIRVLNLKLLALSLPRYEKADRNGGEHAEELVLQLRERSRLLRRDLCPADRRIQAILDRHFNVPGMEDPIRIPDEAFHLDRHGQARALSLPPDRDDFRSRYVSSYRTLQGVLHNPASDRRTTKGTFHISEGGLPIPDDKVVVPRTVFGNLLRAAFRHPAEDLELPFTSTQGRSARTLVTLTLHPLVRPAIEGVSPEKRLEVRFFAPGGLVSNLDFVESIFGNAGDPHLPRNDLALDVERYSGHTGCVILAPHLTRLRKRDLGLPRWKDATPRQRRQGMCWKKANERYNDGGAFKATFRTAEGVMITLIADNYFGYCKKEVKTQIGFAANMMGLAEEEHAGGALVFPSFNLGDYFDPRPFVREAGHNLEEVLKRYSGSIKSMPDGYGIDRTWPQVVYLPSDARMELLEQRITWKHKGKQRELRLSPDHIYLHPTGYKVRMEKHPGAPSWRLVGTVAEGVLCHKPCTVSGGGKSEISKSLSDSILFKSFYVQDFAADIEAARKIIERDFGNRFRKKLKGRKARSRGVLDPSRSLGSVIKLLTPSPEYTDGYNAWVKKIPPHIRALVFAVKRFHRPSWGSDWASHFNVDVTDGRQGYELNYEYRKLVASYLRVGTGGDGKWQIFRLRQDFLPAEKLQVEDDITASTVVPVEGLGTLHPDYTNPSVKFVENCEFRLFQRPDDAKHKGYDKQTERDLSGPNNFISNFEPLSPRQVREIIQDTIEYDKFTRVMRFTLREAALRPEGTYAISSAHARLINGKRSPNPRYLQTRTDQADPVSTYVTRMGLRLARRLPPDAPVRTPVNAVLMGRRNNPADPQGRIRPLAVYNPIHYQELPELFMDLVACLTGKSPSTTGVGSEGALTKGPFNMLLPAADLNAAFLGYALGEYQGYSTPAGYIGRAFRIDHDISLLVPEIWSRLSAREQDAAFLIGKGCLTELKDFTYKGRKVPASRLGYRINETFVRRFLGRMFVNPLAVFPRKMLCPEEQSMADYVDGIFNIAEAQKRAAEAYFRDGTVDDLCPPLQGLVHLMVRGTWKGLTVRSTAFRKMFTREAVLASAWYRERLECQRRRDETLWTRHRAYLEEFLSVPHHREFARELDIRGRIRLADRRLREIRAADYADRFIGTLGADPSLLG